MGGNTRAQAGVVEFLVLTLLMLFLFQQAIKISQDAKEGGILLLEKVIVERSLEELDFAVKELSFTEYGRKRVHLPDEPFISYTISSQDDSFIITAFSEGTVFNKTLKLREVILDCSAQEKSNVSIIVEAWGNGTKVIC